MLNRNTVLPALFILLGLCSLYIIGQFDEPMFTTGNGAKFFPTIVSVFILILCGGLLFQEYMDRNKEKEIMPALFSKNSLFGIVFIVSYVGMIYFIGYLISSLLAFFGYLLFLKSRKITYYVTACIFVFAINYIFGDIFFIALPQGVLF